MLGAEPAEEDHHRGDRQRDLARDHQHRPGDGLVDECGKARDEPRRVRVVVVERDAREDQRERDTVWGSVASSTYTSFAPGDICHRAAAEVASTMGQYRASPAPMKVRCSTTCSPSLRSVAS